VTNCYASANDLSRSTTPEFLAEREGVEVWARGFATDVMAQGAARLKWGGTLRRRSSCAVWGTELFPRRDAAHFIGKAVKRAVSR
jgi:hypothetical protein